tara:strand:+ start:1117 stop:1665 length:549 start_codon:yes stop_codon:yes gene_type:complete
MKIIWSEININNKKVQAQITINEKGDRTLLRNLYLDWKDLNDRLKKIGTRGINLPETISENAFCIFFRDCFRVVKFKGMKSSFDAVNTKTGDRIQIKATSVGSDLTSFGPKSEWDKLFFLDFSKGNGIFKVYKIDPEWIYKHKVNKTQTFEEQQAQGRRPRFSIIKNIIEPKNLNPIKVLKI